MNKTGNFFCQRRLRQRVMASLSMLVFWVIAVSPSSPAVYPTQPAVGDGLLCFSGSGIACFTPATMEKRWEALPDARTFESLITTASVIAGGSTGLHVLDSSDGSVRWTWRGGGEVYSPAVDSQVVYATSRQGQVAALELSGGKVVWERQLEGWLYTPALIPGRVVTGGRAGIVYALDRGTGEIVWRRNLDQELVFRPVAVDDGVVVTTFNGSIVSLDRNGRVRWKERDAVPNFSPAVAGELLVFGGMDGVLRARDSRTGALRWQVELSGQLDIPARAHGGQVAVVSPDGIFALISAGNGSVLARKPVPGIPLGGPVLSPQGAWRAFQRDSGIISWVDASREMLPVQYCPAGR